MPPQKKPKLGKSIPATPSMPAWKPAAMPMATETKTETTPVVLVGTIMAVAICLGAVFGSMALNGIVGVSTSRSAAPYYASGAAISAVPNQPVVTMDTALKLTAAQSICVLTGPNYGVPKLNYSWTVQNLSVNGPVINFYSSTSPAAALNFDAPGDRVIRVAVTCVQPVFSTRAFWGKAYTRTSNVSYSGGASYNVKVIPRIAVANVGAYGVVNNQSRALIGSGQYIGWQIINSATGAAASLAGYSNLNYSVSIVTASGTVGISPAAGVSASETHMVWLNDANMQPGPAKIRVCVNPVGVCGDSASFNFVSSIPACSKSSLAGDVNRDGKANAIDVQMMQSVLTVIPNPIKPFPCADVNNSGAFDASDIILIPQCAAGGCGYWPHK